MITNRHQPKTKKPGINFSARNLSDCECGAGGTKHSDEYSGAKVEAVETGNGSSSCETIWKISSPLAPIRPKTQNVFLSDPKQALIRPNKRPISTKIRPHQT